MPTSTLERSKPRRSTLSIAIDRATPLLDGLPLLASKVSQRNQSLVKKVDRHLLRVLNRPSKEPVRTPHCREMQLAISCSPASHVLNAEKTTTLSKSVHVSKCVHLPLFPSRSCTSRTDYLPSLRAQTSQKYGKLRCLYARDIHKTDSVILSFYDVREASSAYHAIPGDLHPIFRYHRLSTSFLSRDDFLKVDQHLAFLTVRNWLTSLSQ